MHPRPTPPSGYDSWLKYAIETMDTRAVEQQELFENGDTRWSREEMLSAACAELAELHQLAAVATASLPKVQRRRSERQRASMAGAGCS